MKKHHHFHIMILIGLLTVSTILLLVNIYAEKLLDSRSVTFGVSFAPRYAKELNLDPKATYKSILEDLKVKNIRLAAYWDEIELELDHFDFSAIDYYVDAANKHSAKVIMAVGYKLPRWPECRAPHYLSNLGDLSYLRERQLIEIEETIKHFDSNPTISAFQVENEPFLNFGICPPPDKVFFQKEIAHIRSLTKKPLIVTDSGELRTWIAPMQISDIFGTTLYRKVHDKTFGDLYYPLPPWHYRVKDEIIRKLFAPSNQKTIVAELQAELWAAQPLDTLPLQTQLDRFSLDQLKSSIEYAKRTGFGEFYLWGAEWWYYMRAHGHPEYLEYAKGLF